MTDKSWMLKPQAIRYAKECIDLVKEELGIRLKLSHPEFVQLLHEYVELTGSQALGEAYSRLISMAGVGFVVQNLKPKESENVVQLPVKRAVGSDYQVDDNETIDYAGKSYAKYREGMEFRGVYRGQPFYS